MAHRDAGPPGTARGASMRVIAVVNQKGGCGKTTTAINLAGCLSADGARVLVVDLDPQAHATLGLGVDPDQLDANLYEILAEPNPRRAMREICLEIDAGLQLAPSGVVLSALEQKLGAEPVDQRTNRLSRALEEVQDDFDYALIDCPPTVGLLTFNALRAATEAIVPLETSSFAIHGVQKLLETIALLGERVGHDLDVRVLPTLYDGRTRYGRETLAQIRETFGDLCFDSVIRHNVKLREAAARGRPIQRITRRANGTIDYAALAVEVALRGTELAPSPADSPQEDPAKPDIPYREVVLRFRDEGANEVRIAGDFNGWVPDKGVFSIVEAEGEARVWTKILQLAPGGYQYRYVVDGEWREDPDNPETTRSAVGGRNSVLQVR